MSLGNFIKKLIKADALFGGKKKKVSGIQDRLNISSDTVTISATNETITFTGLVPEWLVEGKYFKVIGGGSNDDALFRVLEKQDANTIVLDTTASGVFSPFDYTGPISFDGRIWKVINDETIAKESPETGNTIFNVNKFNWTGREDGSGLAQQFVEHYHDDDGLGGNEEILEALGEPLFHEYNLLGKEFCYNDPKTGQELPFGPLPVVDNEGNQVRSGREK